MTCLTVHVRKSHGRCGVPEAGRVTSRFAEQSDPKDWVSVCFHPQLSCLHQRTCGMDIILGLQIRWLWRREPGLEETTSNDKIKWSQKEMLIFWQKAKNTEGKEHIVSSMFHGYFTAIVAINLQFGLCQAIHAQRDCGGESKGLGCG